MALKVSPAVEDARAAKQVMAGSSSGTIMLKLGLYKRYHWRGALYEAKDAKGNPIIYKFSRAQAVELLQQEDEGRAIWRVHRAQPKESSKPALKLDSDGAVDLSHLDLNKPETLPLGDEHKPRLKQIDIGNDEEVADILLENNAEDTTI